MRKNTNPDVGMIKNIDKSKKWSSLGLSWPSPTETSAGCEWHAPAMTRVRFTYTFLSTSHGLSHHRVNSDIFPADAKQE